MKRKWSDAIALGYHDVTEDLGEGEKPASVAAAVYTLDRSVFAEQIQRIRRAENAGSVVLTFDDGAESAYSLVAGDLERAGLRGSFFITTDWIGRPGFVSAAQIKELCRRGHVIGSHTCSHPERMSKVDDTRLIAEWARSRSILEELLGRPVTVGSIPGGYYSKRVARAAARCGYEVLFTSEPVRRVGEVEGCLVLGRYSIKRNCSPARAVAIAAGRALPCLRQWIEWNAKKPVKYLAGDLYLAARRRWLKAQCQA